jgi:hypothetical protein
MGEKVLIAGVISEQADDFAMVLAGHDMTLQIHPGVAFEYDAVGFKTDSFQIRVNA